MSALPNGERAIVDIRKLADYCLDPDHPRGRHKARVFKTALGIQQKDAGWLRSALLEAARSTEATELVSDSYGTRWRVDASVSRQGKQAVIRSLWMVGTGDDVPRFVTCWIL